MTFIYDAAKLHGCIQGLCLKRATDTNKQQFQNNTRDWLLKVVTFAMCCLFTLANQPKCCKCWITTKAERQYSHPSLRST